jgi:uroporphyrinogen-III decarboxylase
LSAAASVLWSISSTGILARGTPDDVDAACRELIESCGSGGGLILGPGCALAPDTPADNIHALVEAAKRYSPRPVS